MDRRGGGAGVLTLDTSAPLFLASSSNYVGSGGGVLKRKQPTDSSDHHLGTGAIEFPISLNTRSHAEMAEGALSSNRAVAGEKKKNTNETSMVEQVDDEDDKEGRNEVRIVLPSDSFYHFLSWNELNGVLDSAGSHASRAGAHERGEPEAEVTAEPSERQLQRPRDASGHPDATEARTEQRKLEGTRGNRGYGCNG